MIQHNLEPEVAGEPDKLVVYGAAQSCTQLGEFRRYSPRAAHRWKQMKHPRSIRQTRRHHPPTDAPQAIIEVNNIVPHGQIQENFWTNGNAKD